MEKIQTLRLGMFENKKHSYMDLFEGIIIGGSLAAAATFIFGTKKGKELQKTLLTQYKKLGRSSKDMKAKFDKLVHLHTAKKVKSAVKSKAKKVVKKVVKKAKSVKRAVVNKVA